MSVELTETTYFSDQDVTITNKRVIFVGKLYSLSHITSVEHIELKPNNFSSGAAVRGGVLLIVLSLLFFFMESDRLAIVGVIIAMLGVCFIVIGRRIYQPLSNHIVRIGLSSGHVDAFSDRDGDYISKIINALNQAIAEH